MCGIHGFIDKKLSYEQANGIIEKMVLSTIHRGPDNSQFEHMGEAVLGHNRLSIIDLSDLGKQPFTIGNFTIVYNGELYNYREIRQELESFGINFRSDSDTEVLLQAYIMWGEKALSKFLGMWAFAIWDSEARELVCCRDRFGIKPFFYLFESGRFYFASEVKSLKLSPIFTSDLNLNQISRSLQLGWLTYKEETFYTKVAQLEPGTILRLKDDRLVKNQYWTPNLTATEDLSDVDFIDRFQSLLLDSIRIHLRSDVPLGATLSGGIDSSTLVCSLIDQFDISNLNTFSIYYEGPKSVDERPFIKEIETKYKGKFIANYYSPNDESVAEEYNKITFHNDFPLLGSSPISQYFMMKEISKHGIKVILSGQGADDYLGGYMHSYYRFYAEMLRSFRWLRGIREFSYQQKRQHLGVGNCMQVILKSLLSNYLSETSLYRLEYDHYYPSTMNINARNTIQLDERAKSKMTNFHLQLLQQSSLPDLLHYEDRNSMAFSIESRVPFLDHRLVELGLSSDADLKIRNGYTKYVLRESMKNILPTAIYSRTDKKGFVTPGEVKWLRGNLKNLLDVNFKEVDFLNQKVISKLVTAFKNGDDKHANLVWRITALNYWLQHQQ